MVASTKIQFGKEGGTSQFIKQLIHNGQGKLIFDCYQV
jgi:hypothetical protein